MPVRRLPPNPNLDYLKHRAKDLIKGHAAGTPAAAQLLREFHPEFGNANDAEIFAASLRLTDAQLAVARESGFPSWPRLKAHVEKPAPSDQLDLPHHERIQDPTFRSAVDFLDAGDAAGLGAHLKQHPSLVRRRVLFDAGNYFRNPTLLEFVAENPVRHGKLPADILAVAEVILDAGADQSAITETLMLVATGRVPREDRVQIPLIDLLCDHGADPGRAIHAAALHGEFEAVAKLLQLGAPIDLPVAAALGNLDDFGRLLSVAGKDERHLALALASQFGRTEIVRLLLDAGEDPNRYNPVGSHSHATPLHQATLGGREDLVQLLIESGARVDMRDILWNGTPADWARHAGNTELEARLRALEAGRKPD